MRPTKSLFLKRFLALIVCFVLHASVLLAQDESIFFGVVTDARSGEPLIYASVMDTVSKQGALTNEYGFFSLSTLNDAPVLRIAYAGYEPLLVTNLQSKQELNLQLMPIQELQAVEVNAKSQIQDANIGIQELELQYVEKLPVFLGEKDVLRTLTLLPGVSSGGEGTTGIYVRGGGPDQNLILLDGVPVYNVSHLFGFFSVFNADALSKVTLYKSGFPANYGGRVSSVLDMRLKEGNIKAYNMEGSIGLISSRFLLEGPIKRDKTAFAISARRTYLDLLTYPYQLLNKNQNENLGGYFFYDLNAKVHHKINDKHHLYLSGYFGNDKGFANQKQETPDRRLSESSKLRWGNEIAAFRWNYIISPKLFLNTTTSFSKYEFALNFEERMEDFEDEEESYRSVQQFFSGIRDWTQKSELTYAHSSKLILKTGVGVTFHKFTPGGLSSKFEGEDIQQDTTIVPELINTTEAWQFVHLQQEIGSRLNLNYGLHNAIFLVNNETLIYPQPRLSASYVLNEISSVKLGASRSAQFLHLLSNQGIGLPTDLWVPATDSIPPVTSWESSVGYHRKLGKSYWFSAEAYYKVLENVTQYAEGANFIGLSQGISNKVTSGLGTCYGLELLLRKTRGKLTGWVGYTMSWATRQFDEINGGRPFYYKYDRRHDLSISGVYQFNQKWDVGAVFVFWTGNAITLPPQMYTPVTGHYLPNYSFQGASQPVGYFENFNDYRMPNYHRLDLGVNRTKKKKWGESVLSISVYNIYNRQNAFFLFVEEDLKTGDKRLMQQSLFPIIPSISWKFKFTGKPKP